jgi:hypothetical protein
LGRGFFFVVLDNLLLIRTAGLEIKALWFNRSGWLRRDTSK